MFHKKIHDYLTKIKTALKKEGIFSFSTSNFLTNSLLKSSKWGSLSSPPIYINFFTKENLEKTLKVAGFEEVKIFKRRLYRPERTIESFYKHFKMAVYLKEPLTLHGTARKN
jgi:hypothetical protein